MKWFKKKEKKEHNYIPRMDGQDYIDSTRAYLDYLEEHLNNIAKAFTELTDACDGKEYWASNLFDWELFKREVMEHDLSKFTKEEFVQYRDNFFPVSPEDNENSDFSSAWENHKICNPHHHESAKGFMDIAHMLIDWMAMGYKFNDNPWDYYEKMKDSLDISEDHRVYLLRLLNNLKEWRTL